jgi:hypothetical protein
VAPLVRRRTGSWLGVVLYNLVQHTRCVIYFTLKLFKLNGEPTSNTNYCVLLTEKISSWDINYVTSLIHFSHGICPSGLKILSISHSSHNTLYLFMQQIPIGCNTMISKLITTYVEEKPTPKLICNIKRKLCYRRPKSSQHVVFVHIYAVKHVCAYNMPN